MTDRETAIEMHRRICDSTNNWQGAEIFVERPELMMHIASHLAVAVGGATPDYLTADAPATNDSADVVMVVASRVIWVHVADDNWEVSTSIFQIGF